MKIERLLDIAPGENNPRNSEGSFLALKDGRIVWIYSRYRGNSADDHAYAEIAAIFWDGTSFSDPVVLARPEPGTDETNYMSVSTARMNNGDAAVFYLIKHKGISSEYVMRRSADEFRTLGEPVRVLDPLYPAYFVLNNDRVLRAADGRWLAPASWTASVMNFRGQGEYVYGRAKAVFFESRDDGATWRQLSDFIALPGGGHSGSGLQEPGLYQLPDRTLCAYFRTDLGRQYESFSPDGGATWSEPRPSAFTSPCAPMLIKRNPYSGKYAAVWNPTPETPFRYYGTKKPSIWTGGRSPLVLAFSDDGLRFGEPQVIEDDPEGGFCYPALHFTGPDGCLLSYCAGSGRNGDEMCLVRSRIVRIEF
jgi:hypothetical protein